MGQALEQAIGFIGAGQMATAMAGGFVTAGLADPSRIWASDPSAMARERFAAAVAGAHVVAENAQVARAARDLLLAVKPQHVDGVLGELKAYLGPEHLLVSIAAGVRLGRLASLLPPGVRVVRVMPNMPCLVGQSASGYSLGQGVTQADADLVARMLSAIGLAFSVEEPLLDAVTGLAGSGPAYVYMVIEALSDGGVLAGLPRNISTALAAQTVRGAAEMVLQTGEHPAALKDRVASPGGTTIAGLRVLERSAVREALMAAVEAASRRSAELGSGGVKGS
jgi:pyrroline-5-carboxylate reductase